MAAGASIYEKTHAASSRSPSPPRRRGHDCPRRGRAAWFAHRFTSCAGALAAGDACNDARAFLSRSFAGRAGCRPDCDCRAPRSCRRSGTVSRRSRPGHVRKAASTRAPGAVAGERARALHPQRRQRRLGSLDPNFQGYASLRADAEGRYRIKTVKPAPYSGRTAHLHFNVAARGARLTTQMFFEGERLNERDGLYRALSREERRAATGRWTDRSPDMEADAVVAAWDIVMNPM